VGDLTTRYRFIERYATAAEGAESQMVGQSRIGIVETIKTQIENPRGAPDNRQLVAQTIYTERPAVLGTDGGVTAAVRRYDAFRLRPDIAAKPSDPRPLEGLSVWYQKQPGGDSLVLSLTEGRGLRAREFGIISGQVFVPALAAVLPPGPSRIGDRWRVPRNAARALLGPQAPSDEVVLASFKDLHMAAKGTDLVATLSLTARTTPYQGEIRFTFAAPAPPADDSKGSTVEARGYITELRSAQSMTTPLPESNGRLHQTQTRELILGRERDSGAPLPIPDPKPMPTEANSWLTYVDPRGRFHLRHPQWYADESSMVGEMLILVRQRPEGPDVLTLHIQVQTGDAAADRRNLDPEFHRKELEERWRLERQVVEARAHGWLPEADWKPAGLKVYRIEAVSQGQVAAGGRPLRLHLDDYLILTSRAESLVMTAQTVQDSPLAFRTEAEAILKTFRFGLPEK
jgi:hypothetical protein